MDLITKSNMPAEYRASQFKIEKAWNEKALRPLIFFHRSVAFITKEVNRWLAKHPLKTNGHLDNLELTSSLKGATGVNFPYGK